ncbi:putative disease resistance protein RGA4 [Cannabis sativa]|uniref:putative disease resistance protein RGA4 n=1 Tax=Cannabis sativa TaxID=3483 RepID=UPI0029C9C65A|nr:putative disease resistance protein RGA4 [Cannabis sativa]
MAGRNSVGVVHRIQVLLRSSGFEEVAATATIFKLRSFRRKLWWIKEAFQMVQNLFDRADLMKQVADSDELDMALRVVDDLLREMLVASLRRRHMSVTQKLFSFRTFFYMASKMDQVIDMVKLLTSGSLLLPSLHDLPITSVGRDIGDAVRMGSSSYVFDEIVVGRVHEKQKVKELLLKEDVGNNVLVISILGLGGIGKTTLAQIIYKDEMVADHFHLRIWVYVGEVFDVITIMQTIVGSIKNSGANSYRDVYQLEELRNLIFQEIRDKRFLLILDDVWNQDYNKWDELRSILFLGGKGSRVIVTTRNRSVALITGEKHQIFELGELEYMDSSLLFLKVTEGVERNYVTDPEMIKLREGIVKRCSGNPLFIKVVGSLLRLKSTKEWQSFYDKEFSDNIEIEDPVLAAVRVSYDHLSFALKDCFAYCALFPKDYEFDVDTLVSLWMSQGFIIGLDDKEQYLEKLGYEYVVELLERSFFHEIQRNELGYITKCKVHNLMHDLAKNIAGKAYATLSLNQAQFEGEPLHVSVDFHFDSSWQISIPSSNLRGIRSLILHRQYPQAIESRSSQSICDVIPKFKWIGMLDLHNTGIKILPKSIGELKFLSYLDLSQNVNMKALPNSISRLQLLQTLKLNHCSNLQTLPRGITKLTSLRNLQNKSCYCLTQMPRGLHQLSNLRTLSEFGLCKEPTDFPLKPNGKLEELSSLNYLRGELKIKNLTNPKDDKTAAANLKEKKDLLSLILIWDIEASSVHQHDDYEKALEDLEPHPNLKRLSISTYGGRKFSSWLPLLKNLVKLSLSRCNRCHCLPPLDQLTNLQVLVVDELVELEYIMDEPSKTRWFSSLKELRLTNLPQLEGWFKDDSCENATFSGLSKLVVEDCPSLTSMPLFLCLEELLVLKNTSWKPLQQTMALPATQIASSSSSLSSPLSKLSELHIMDMSNGDPNMWQSLHRLHSVTLDHVTDINDQLEGLRQVRSLQQLHIRHCDSLEEIPNWITNSDSLRTISIKLCPKLTIPRERLSFITTSKKVEIEDCPRVSHIATMLKDPLYTQ